MTDFTLNPANYQMKGNPPKASVAAIAPEQPDLSRLDSMSREDLLGLVERYAKRDGHLICLNDDETAMAMMDTLAQTALRPITTGVSIKADIQSRIVAIDKWLDRTRGKAMQQIKQDVNVSGAIALVSKDEVRDIIDNWLGKTIEHAPS